MTQIYRELTGREKRRIKKLITSRCANYDKEYGCLPLDCECPMFGICYTNSALCRKFRNTLLPTAPELQAVFQPMPLTVCKQCGKVFPKDGKRVYVPKKPDERRPQPECGSTEQSRNKIRCNHFALGKPCVIRPF